MMRALVTGVTGRHGATGAHVARRLKSEGHDVRVLVRRDDERAEVWRAAGFDVRLGDLRERRTLITALDGVTHVSFCYPVDAGIVDAAANFSAAMRDASASARVVVMSMIPSHPESPSHLGRAQWLAEEVMTWAGLDVCILRIAALFFENLIVLHGADIRERNVIRNCFGDARAPWIAGEDAAELVVAALLDARTFADRVHRPPGSVVLSHAEIAKALESLLERTIRYEAISASEWREELTARRDDVVNADMAKHISTLARAMSLGGAQVAPDTSALARLIGKEPLTFDAFVRGHRDAFNNARTPR
jgi:uncharacterized protein YbjT (DUF2867 family)